ncbi:MAG TPA: DUF58 domain-containing protein [Gaiellaceae bacterium]|nr:DUF58 domain-containing protein [Gaiellaceae bacterium]
MLTDRGRSVLALGGFSYLAAWAFGSPVLYPVALGLVLAVVAGALWVRFLRRPVTFHRLVPGGERVAGDDVPVEVVVRVEGSTPPTGFVVSEKIARLGGRETPLRRAREGELRGSYVLPRVPRGRYPIESAEVVIEDPFALERVEIQLPAGESLLVYPRLVDLDVLFSESGSRAPDGRRLLLRRSSGFELHSVREYEQGESLRRVHWPSTARRAQLMVKELEDAPRDEVAVLLDADASVVAGDPPDTSFELEVQVAGSLLQAHARRGRRASLVVSSRRPVYQPVHSFDGEWKLALEQLAAVEPDGAMPVSTMLANETGPAARALELAVVTAVLTPRLADRLLQRTLARHGVSLVYVDPVSFQDPGASLPADASAQLVRLRRAGIPIAVVRRGDDLRRALSGDVVEAAVG